MLYEVYFDSSNTFREYMLKSNFIDELYALEDNSRLRHSFDKIVEFLEPHTQHLLYLPHQEGEGIEIVIETKGEVKTVESDWGDNMNTQLISSIKANNKELLTNNDDLKIQNFLSFDLKISSLLEIISNVYGIPLSKINNSSDLDEDVNLMIGAKGFKKLA
jgi:hypothetical protein